MTSPPRRLGLSRGLRSHLVQQAAAAFPAEACGLLHGRRRGAALWIDGAAPARNLCAGAARDRFELDPADRIALQRRLREAGAAARILGAWHSHPSGDARPSAQDAARAWEPGLLWVIVAGDRLSAQIATGLCGSPDTAFLPLALWP